MKKNSKIYTINDPEQDGFLRTPTQKVDFSRISQGDISRMVQAMFITMKSYYGIGLSANQVGLPYRFFIAQIPEKEKDGILEFGPLYALFNPVIEKRYGKLLLQEEGCLSVPGLYGVVERNEKVVLSAQDINGRFIKIKAKGLLAHVFQHEVDHLDGVIFLDKARDVHKHEPEDLSKKKK